MRLEIVKEDFGIEVQVVGDQVASMAFKGHIAAIRADHTVVRRSLACLPHIINIYEPGFLCCEIADEDISLPVVIPGNEVGSPALKHDVTAIVAD